MISLVEFAERRCSSGGKWEGKPGASLVNNQGWTNYTNCYLPGVLKLLRKLGNETEVRYAVLISNLGDWFESFFYKV